MERLTRYSLGVEPELIRVVRPLDGWGPWRPLLGTPFESLVPQVSLDAHQHAVYGWMNPLRKELGNPPDAVLRKLAGFSCRLANPEDCRIATRWCQPSGKTPTCYEFPHLDPEVANVMTYLVRCWVEKCWCFVLESP